MRSSDPAFYGPGDFGDFTASFPTWTFPTDLNVQEVELGFTPVTSLLNQHLINLISVIETLTEKINALELRLQELTPPSVAPRRVDDQQAKTEIKALFEAMHGQTVFASDVAEELYLDYDQVSRLLSELENEGQIASARKTDDASSGTS